jgi:hypothetical protein
VIFQKLNQIGSGKQVDILIVEICLWATAIGGGVQVGLPLQSSIQTSLLPCTVPRSMREAVHERSQELQSSHAPADQVHDNVMGHRES